VEGKIDKWVMLVIGLVGGWVISTAPGWMQASSHEHWWDIATAVGTVGSAFAAVVGFLFEQHRGRQERRRQAWFALKDVWKPTQIIRAKLSALECVMKPGMSEENRLNAVAEFLKIPEEFCRLNMNELGEMAVVAQSPQASKALAEARRLSYVLRDSLSRSCAGDGLHGKDLEDLLINNKSTVVGLKQVLGAVEEVHVRLSGELGCGL